MTLQEQKRTHRLYSRSVVHSGYLLCEIKSSIASTCRVPLVTAGLTGCFQNTNILYHAHISINSRGGTQLAARKGGERHVADQLGGEAAAHWGDSQPNSLSPRSAGIHAVDLLYMKHSRLEICICQTSSITPAACHTWGSSRPSRGGKDEV